MEKTFSQLLRSYRQREGLTLAELARRCGQTAQYLHSVEQGGDPSVTRADEILTRLGLSLPLGSGPSFAEFHRRKKKHSKVGG